MKKLFILLLPMLVFTSCSIDEDETGIYENPITDLNAEVQNEGCDMIIVDYFGDYGEIHITNDNENLYITVAANEGLSLKNVKLHVADDYAGFPTVGNGNLPPGQMDINRSFHPAVENYTFTFSLEDYDFENDEIVIAAKADFTNGAQSSSSWAGDIPGPKGNWFYLTYDLQKCTVVEDPCANYYNNIYTSVCSGSVNNLTLLGVTNYFKNQIFLNTDLTTITGTFSPSMAEMLVLIQNGGLEGTYTTTYSVETSECGMVSFDITAEVSNCN